MRANKISFSPVLLLYIIIISFLYIFLSRWCPRVYSRSRCPASRVQLSKLSSKVLIVTHFVVNSYGCFTKNCARYRRRLSLAPSPVLYDKSR